MKRKVAILGLVSLALLLLMALGGALSPTLAQAGFPFRLLLPYIVRNAVSAPSTLPPGPPPTSVPETPSPEPVAPRTIEVIAQIYEFVPGTIEVQVGEAVRFVVSSPDMFHTFTVKRNAGAQDILINLSVVPNAAPVETTYTFTEPGDYYLYCIPHEGLGMTGVIRVTE
jgi:plastocyanin